MRRRIKTPSGIKNKKWRIKSSNFMNNSYSLILIKQGNENGSYYDNEIEKNKVIKHTIWNSIKYRYFLFLAKLLKNWSVSFIDVTNMNNQHKKEKKIKYKNMKVYNHEKLL